MSGPIKPRSKYADDRAFDLESVHDVFVRELSPILGEGILADQVHAIIRPIVTELVAHVGHGIAGEIADRLGLKAVSLEGVTLQEQRASALLTALTWREAERIARTHIETGGEDVAGGQAHAT